MANLAFTMLAANDRQKKTAQLTRAAIKNAIYIV